jgi:hypothetical protein
VGFKHDFLKVKQGRSKARFVARGVRFLFRQEREDTVFITDGETPSEEGRIFSKEFRRLNYPEYDNAGKKPTSLIEALASNCCWPQNRSIRQGAMNRT